MKILIWGTGRLARNYMKYGFFNGYEIVGFVDSYPKQKSFMEYNVYRPHEISCITYDYIIVCVLKDNRAILRTCIEQKLELGKILFLCENAEFEGMDSKYVQQLSGMWPVAHYFPLIYRERVVRQKRRKYYHNVLQKELTDNAFIHCLEGDKHIVAWIPVELIFSERTEDSYRDGYTQEWLMHNKERQNIPIISFGPYRNLYRFFMQGAEYPYHYCEWYQKLFTSRGIRSEFTDAQLIERRFCEFGLMQFELNKGMDFFIMHPAIAKWNSRGYFNLVDGHHRTSFLYYSGLTRMPVQMTKEDYELWCNREVAEVVREMIAAQQRTEFYQPILNPYFLYLRSKRENYAKSRLHHLLEFFGNRRFHGKKVIDIGANLGYMGQAFCRMGAEVTLLEPDNSLYEFMLKINELLHTKCEIVTQKFEEFETDKCYDIAILLTVFCHCFSKEAVRESFIRHLNKNISQMIIWESGDLCEEEKKYILQHTKFRNYKHICYTYATGKFRELGLFMTDDSEYFGGGIQLFKSCNQKCQDGGLP